MLGGVLQTLTGMGLATSAGLNAYIPLLLVGLLGRYTDVLTLPASWQWLENGWTIGILLILLAIEVVADKIPIIDHANDVIQTVIRPTSGGLVFGATSSDPTVQSLTGGPQQTTVTDPGSFFSGNQWMPVVAGIVIALTVHGMKAAARPVVNATTAGFGAPVVSTIEDFFSVLIGLIAIVLPLLVLFIIVLMFVGFFWLMRKRRRRKERKAAQRAARYARY
jgi:hypothetical protein